MQDATVSCNLKLHCAAGLAEDQPPVSRTSPRPRGPTVVRRVLEVTLEELGRVGYAALSLPHVAELAAINKTSLYRRWPTKDALVAAALGLATPPVAELADHGALERDLVALAETLGRFLSSPAGLGLLRMLFADGDPAQTRALAASMWTAPGPRAPRVVLERAIARGELSPDAEFDLLLFTLAGAVLHRIFVECAAPDTAWARRIVRLLVEGAAPQPKRARPKPSARRPAARPVTARRRPPGRSS